ncbi:N-6 DNA methylase [Bowmanella pacifica]|nr:N-6 DNA methylase [Bowmanella pacifica]
MSNKKYELGQYMTPLSVGAEMVNLIENKPEDWYVFDPSCGDGNLLLSAIKALKNKSIEKIQDRIFGFDIDPDMVAIAKRRISDELSIPESEVHIFEGDSEVILKKSIIPNEYTDYLSKINIVIANPPYGKNREYRFFNLCDELFSAGTEMIFLQPLAFIDRVKGVKYKPLDGRPLGVTTGHVIVTHKAGTKFTLASTSGAKSNSSEFEVLTGLKLYAVGEGNPPQSEEIKNEKPFSSDIEIEGWLPCLRTGDIQPYSVNKKRLWVKYGPHLAHPKDIERFSGPKLFVRRVPIWENRMLGAAYDDEVTLCAGDVLVIKHKENNIRLLKGLCAYLNSENAADFILNHRPSVKHRMSFPKISAKDLNVLLDTALPSDTKLIELSECME